MAMYRIEMESGRERAYMYAYRETMQEVVAMAIPCCDRIVSCSPTDAKLFCIVRPPQKNSNTFELYYQGVRLPVKADSLQVIEHALSNRSKAIDGMFNDFELFQQTVLEIDNNGITIKNAIPKKSTDVLKYEVLYKEA